MPSAHRVVASAMLALVAIVTAAAMHKQFAQAPAQGDSVEGSERAGAGGRGAAPGGGDGLAGLGASARLAGMGDGDGRSAMAGSHTAMRGGASDAATTALLGRSSGSSPSLSPSGRGSQTSASRVGSKAASSPAPAPTPMPTGPPPLDSTEVAREQKMFQCSACGGICNLPGVAYERCCSARCASLCPWTMRAHKCLNAPVPLAYCATMDRDTCPVACPPDAGAELRNASVGQQADAPDAACCARPCVSLCTGSAAAKACAALGRMSGCGTCEAACSALPASAERLRCCAPHCEVRV
mmetsp:Transcript_23808/g.60283  ORF Transcript_23808/g.60283 Transcript_23808/m.60283 type:complete len:297 (+) Transcript_23808:112-1002(+)